MHVLKTKEMATSAGSNLDSRLGTRVKAEAGKQFNQLEPQYRKFPKHIIGYCTHCSEQRFLCQYLLFV